MRDWYVRGVCGIAILVLLGFGLSELQDARFDMFYDRLFIIGIVVLSGALYKRMNISLPVLSVGLLALVLHSGKFYGKTYFGLPFDHYMHFLAGLALALIFFQYMSQYMSLPATFALTICVVAGIGSFMEVMEFAGYHIGGEGEGVFFYGQGDAGEWDNAARDMINNTLGALLGCSVMLVGCMWRRKSTQISISENL